MTLRELVQQAGGINSPVMDYELEFRATDDLHSQYFSEVKQVVNMNQEQGNPKTLLLEIKQ